MATLLFQPTPHTEAVDFIASKPVVSREVFDGLLPELKGRAFVITGIEDANVVQQIRDLVAALPAGADWEVEKKLIAALASPFFVDPAADAETQAKQQAAAEARAELLLRTHGQQAYAASAYQVQDRQWKVFPFWQYHSMQDGRVRRSHAALDGIVLPADHPFWNVHYPPWAWGCRCLIIPLSRSDYADLQAKDAARPEMERSILQGTRLRRLEQENKINLGPDADIDVRSDVERGKEGAFQWHPGDVRLTAAELKDRYDPETWSLFEGWAKKTLLNAEGSTVWEWLNGKKPSPDPLTDELFGGRKIKNELNYSAKAALRNFFGRELEDGEVAKLFGAPNESTLKGWLRGDERVEVSVLHPLIKSQVRTLFRDGDDLVLENELFIMEKIAPKGFGTRSFASEAKQAAALGVVRIETHAAGKPYNGYYTWPRLGYSAPLDTWFQRQAELDLGVQVRDLLELFSVPGGPAWWKKHGGSVVVTFDLTDDSRNWQALLAYVAAAKVNFIALSADSIMPNTEEPEPITADQIVSRLPAAAQLKSTWTGHSPQGAAKLAVLTATTRGELEAALFALPEESRPAYLAARPDLT